MSFKVNNVRSILLIKNDGIGDLILSSGIINGLYTFFGAEIDLVTCEENREIAEAVYGLRNIFFISRDELRYNRFLSRLGIFKFFHITKGDEAVIDQIKQQNYDLAICLRRFIRASSLFIMRNVNAKQKFCMWEFPTNINFRLAKKYSQEWCHLSTDRSVRHEMSYYQAIIQEIFGEHISDCYPRLRFASIDKKNKASGRKLGICIGGGKVRNWPLKNWVKLVQILEDQKWEIYLFGGKNSAKAASTIQKCCADVKNFVGKLNFRDSVEILNSLNGFIGNDTGFTHFASLFLPKVLIIYGGRSFRRFFPWPGAPNQYLIFYGLDCFDCRGRCKHIFQRHRCFKYIKPNQVFRYFKEIMQSTGTEHFRNLNPETIQYRSTDGINYFSIDGSERSAISQDKNNNIVNSFNVLNAVF